MLIEEEEQKLYQLMNENQRAFGGAQYHEDSQSSPSHEYQVEPNTLKKTNSGNHLISPHQNKLNKKLLSEATNRLYEDSSRRAHNIL